MQQTFQTLIQRGNPPIVKGKPQGQRDHPMGMAQYIFPIGDVNLKVSANPMEDIGYHRVHMPFKLIKT